MTAAVSPPDHSERHLRAVEDEPYDKAPPHNVEAERVTLGTLMLSSSACDTVFDLLTSRDFYRPVHSTIFSAVLGLWAANEPTDPLAVANALTPVELQRVGGAAYLHTCIEAVPTAPNAGYYARMVAEAAARRRLIEAGTKVIQVGYGVEAGHDLEDAVDQAQKAVHEATVRSDAGSLVRVSEFSDAEFAYLEQVVAGEIPHGISSGLGQLDDLLGGFLPGQLIIPAGRPGMGKTVAGLGFAVAAARRGLPSIVFTLEMGKRELWWRLLSRVGEINLDSFTTGRLTIHELERVREAKKVIDGWPLHIDDQANTVPAIRSAARRFRQRHGALAITFVDYLQRLKATTKADRRDLEVGAWARDFKTMAKELQTTLVVPSQLNRGPEGRSDKRPQLSDMRDSGEVEQEADVVILLHRDDYYDKESKRAGEIDFIIAKHRNGPTDTVTLAAQLHYARFADWTDTGHGYR